MKISSPSLTGHLWLKTGGIDLALPLSVVRHVALGNQLRVCRPRTQLPAWWQGVMIDGDRAHALLGLGELIGLPDSPQAVRDTVVVMTSIGNSSAGLVCDRVLGLIPERVPARRLPSSLFSTGIGAFPEVRLWESHPVVTVMPESLFTTKSRAQFDLAMETSRQDVDLLWELSELEQKLASAPSAKGCLELAARYRELGWDEEATRMEARAAEMKPEAGAPQQNVSALTGPFTRRVSMELLQVLHLTGKSGELQLQAPSGAMSSVWFDRGVIVDARSGDTDDAMISLRRICGIRAGHYQFRPGTPDGAKQARLDPDSAAVIAELGKHVSSNS